MPPKKEPANKKTEKQKQKIIEDKTFGLKNKKGKKQQQFVKNVTQQVKGTSKRQDDSEKSKVNEKRAEEEKLNEIKSLFKPVIEKQIVDNGVDPKSVLCAYFKLGTCTKGDKCKFSHDLTAERRTEKKDIYSDNRENIQDIELEDLEKMIEKKHGKNNASEKICKHFLEAVEKKLYGWFWVCPNGGDNCQYKHALPAGYVLKREKSQPVQHDEIPIEEIIENQRSQLDGELIPINEESFKAWKIEKIKQKRIKLEQEMNQKREELLSGKIVSSISGRDAFVLDPSLITQDDDEAEIETLPETENEKVMSYEEILAQKISSIKVQDDVATKAFTLNPKHRMIGNSLT